MFPLRIRTLSAASLLAPLLLLVAGLLGTALPTTAQALSCGSNNGYTCTGTGNQYAGSFNPGVGQGGFGGGSCTASKTPVVFVHGNGDNAISFDMPAAAVSGYGTPPNSVYAELKAAGYNDCELFGITYLDASQQPSPQFNYHAPATYQVLKTFIDKVKAYTGKSQVDIVSHSLGASMSLAMIKYHSYQGSVRRFINIAGGLRGLQTCRSTGYQSAYATTCNAEAYVFPYDYYTFGLYPSTGVSFYGYNRWTGSGAGSLRTFPASYSGIRFYTLTAGLRDQVHCFTTSYSAGCSDGALFNNATNVYAQLDIGAGSSAYSLDWNWKDGSPYNVGGGDTSNGVGHFRSKNNAGVIIRNMLTSDCSTGCAAGYEGLYGPAVNR